MRCVVRVLDWCPTMAESSSAPFESPLRILVVEDEPVARDALVSLLRDEKAAVFAAADGLDALNVLDHERIDLVLLDLMLPHLDGEHLLARLRRRGAMPVIVVSAKRAEADRVRMLDLGADDYLVKPFLAGELLARIRAVLRRAPRAEPAGRLAVGNLTLDTSIRAAARGNARVSLTEQEFIVLKLLMERHGTLVSRETVERAIHPDEPAEVSNVVDVVILRLRKKLGRDLIVTRRGQGYMLDG